MDYRNKIFVIYDSTSDSDLVTHFREFTDDYSTKFLEISNLSASRQYGNIFFVTTNPDNLDIIRENFSKYTKNLQIVIMSSDKKIIYTTFPKYVHPIYMKWIGLGEKIRYHYNELYTVFEKIESKTDLISYSAKQDLRELLEFGGQKFLDYVKKFGES